jgi:hypothetical protein
VFSLFLRAVVWAAFYSPLERTLHLFLYNLGTKLNKDGWLHRVTRVFCRLYALSHWSCLRGHAPGQRLHPWVLQRVPSIVVEGGCISETMGLRAAPHPSRIDRGTLHDVIV